MSALSGPIRLENGTLLYTRVDPAARARTDALALKALAIVRAQEAAEKAARERAA